MTYIRVEKDGDTYLVHIRTLCSGASTHELDTIEEVSALLKNSVGIIQIQCSPEVEEELNNELRKP